MNLRLYKSEDIDEIARLFYDTVHTVNAKDYTFPQLDAWADGKLNKQAWDEALLRSYTMLAVHNDIIIGFANLDGDYLDRLYVHKDWQGRGAAALLCDALEAQAMLDKTEVLETHASITARGFFEKRGYNVIKQQTVVRNGIELTNYVMQKRLLKQLV